MRSFYSCGSAYLRCSRHPLAHGTVTQPVDPLPARALHSDLLDRFKSLTGSSTVTEDSSSRGEKHEDDKTVEELLADLGPTEQWDVGKSEQDEVEDLLRSANTALGEEPKLEQVPEDEKDVSDQQARRATHQMPSIDISVFQPEPESEEDEEPRQNKSHLRDAVNDEADDVLKRLMDEVKYEQAHTDDNSPKHADADSESGSEGESDKLALPSAPSQSLPSPCDPAQSSSTSDADLAARFASLSRPSVPQSDSVLPTVPSTFTSKSENTKPTDSDIDTWCRICLDDATLRCIGCDGDLYCQNCWMEGHRGEDAGMEERLHRAIEYVKGGGKKKQANKRVAMGA